MAVAFIWYENLINLQGHFKSLFQMTWCPSLNTPIAERPEEMCKNIQALCIDMKSVRSGRVLEYVLGLWNFT